MGEAINFLPPCPLKSAGSLLSSFRVFQGLPGSSGVIQGLQGLQGLQGPEVIGDRSASHACINNNNWSCQPRKKSETSH